MKQIIKDRKEMESSIEDAIKKFMEENPQLSVSVIHIHSDHSKHVKTNEAMFHGLKIKTEIELL